MFRNIKELIKYRELLYILVWRDVSVKYKQSIMGYLWAIFMPMVLISVGVLVRLGMSFLSGSTFAFSQIITVSVKALPWSLFISSVRFGVNSLLGNSTLVTKIYFPKEVFPISAVLSQLFDFSIAAGTLTILLIIAKIGLSIYLVWVPFLLAVLLFMSLAVAISLSAANLFFRDVKYLVEVILSMGIFFTPVFYDVKMAGKYAWILMLNPVAPILEGLNACIVLHESPQIEWILYSIAVGSLGLIISYLFFKKVEPQFAESI
jgi:homopolymeric O-antigen transport system permease protein